MDSSPENIKMLSTYMKLNLIHQKKLYLGYVAVPNNAFERMDIRFSMLEKTEGGERDFTHP